MNAQELANKIDWEGGVFEALLYGLSSKSLSRTAPKELINAWDGVCQIWKEQFEPALRKLNRLLPEPNDGKE